MKRNFIIKLDTGAYLRRDRIESKWVMERYSKDATVYTETGIELLRQNSKDLNIDKLKSKLILVEVL